MYPPLQLQSGLFDAASGLVSVAATVVLLLLLTALAGFVYRSLRGDGIRWPDERPPEDDGDGGVRRGNDDDEWKYY